MSFGINGIGTGSALSALGHTQSALQESIDQLSSGKRITSAAVDPSGLAIYNTLSAQANGYDTANLNVSDATSAINVAQGAAGGIGDALNRLGSLAIEANNGFLSSTDRAALQGQANALVQQINGDASTVNFNGTTLLAGGLSGSTPATNASATITTSDQTNSGSNVVTSVAASAATTSGTFTVSIANTGAAAVADVTYTDSVTQTTTIVGQFAAGSSTTYNGTTLNFGAFTTSDTYATATVQTQAAQAGSAQPSISVQSGANQGQTTSVSVPNATTSGLGIQNLDFSSNASATNSLGQINAAIVNLGAGEAQLGAETSSLGRQFDNNNVASNALTAAASAIGDVNQGQASTSIASQTLQQQISIAVLNRANTDAGHLNAFLSTYA